MPSGPWMRVVDVATVPSTAAAVAPAPPGAAPAFSLVGDVGPWLVALAILAIVGFVAILFVRARLRREPVDDSAFSLESLRRLHRDGRLTDAEFNRARDAMIASAKQAMAKSEERRKSGR